jgi:hypothetical protein
LLTVRAGGEGQKPCLLEPRDELDERERRQRRAERTVLPAKCWNRCETASRLTRTYCCN